MSQIRLSEAVRLFIAQYIDSVSLLEILLFLKNQDRGWKTTDQIIQQLRLNHSAAALPLERLCEFGLIEENSIHKNQYRYAPVSETLGETVNQLVEEHKIMPHQVYQEIYSPVNRLKHVSDAFVIRRKIGKKENEDG